MIRPVSYRRGGAFFEWPTARKRETWTRYAARVGGSRDVEVDRPGALSEIRCSVRCVRPRLTRCCPLHPVLMDDRRQQLGYPSMA